MCHSHFIKQLQMLLICRWQLQFAKSQLLLGNLMTTQAFLAVGRKGVFDLIVKPCYSIVCCPSNTYM